MTEAKIELQKYAPLKHRQDRPIILPEMPKDSLSTNAEALRAVLSCEIERPTVPSASVIGQHVAMKALERELVTPYTHKEAVTHEGTQKGVLLYGPPGNGKVDKCINHLHCNSMSNTIK